MPQYSDYINIDSNKRFGKPCIKGTRISVCDILKWLSSGMSTEEIVNDYPELSKNHIVAALSFASDREQHINLK